MDNHTRKKSESMPSIKNILKKLQKLTYLHSPHLLALLVIFLWCIPYISTENLIELGDFSFFSQAYEAIRISILDYHQFPWWNPWMNGGVPLYANPQMGVFSIQTVLALLFGAPLGLKYAMVIYTVAGYFSMYILLHKYFKVRRVISIPLSLSWIFSSFFVAHLPSHFTFLWFMILPLFIYLALTIRTKKQGLILGIALAIMALSAVHYSLFYTCIIVALIMLYRLFFEIKLDKKSYLLAATVAASTFIILAGHRIIHAFINVKSFNREVFYDPNVTIGQGLKALLFPFNRTDFVANPATYPLNTPFGWGETTSTIGVVLSALAIICFVYFLFIYKKLDKKTNIYIIGFILLGCLAFSIGLGNLGPWSPYGLMKNLPMLDNLRVSTRWFIFVSLCLLIFIALVATKIKRSINRRAVIVLIYIGCAELFLTNLWYQNNVFTHTPDVSTSDVRDYKFDQTAIFGKTLEFPEGKRITNHAPSRYYYREYEATTYNIGVIRANEALVNNMYADKVRCAIEEACGYIKSNNARIIYWSPNQINLERTGTGTIVVNVNNSSYYSINGKRNHIDKTAEVLGDLRIDDPSKLIIINIKPDLIN